MKWTIQMTLLEIISLGTSLEEKKTLDLANLIELEKNDPEQFAEKCQSIITDKIRDTAFMNFTGMPGSFAV